MIIPFGFFKKGTEDSGPVSPDAEMYTINGSVSQGDLLTDFDLSAYSTFTLAITVKIPTTATDNTNQFIASGQGSNTAFYIRRSADDSFLRTQLYQLPEAATSVDTEFSLPWNVDGDFHQVVITYASNTAATADGEHIIYVDGVEQFGITNGAFEGWTSTRYLRLGAAGNAAAGTGNFTGSFSSVQFYSVALSSTDIANIYIDDQSISTNRVLNLKDNKTATTWTDGTYTATVQGTVVLEAKP